MTKKSATDALIERYKSTFQRLHALAWNRPEVMFGLAESLLLHDQESDARLWALKMFELYTTQQAQITTPPRSGRPKRPTLEAEKRNNGRLAARAIISVYRRMLRLMKDAPSWQRPALLRGWEKDPVWAVNGYLTQVEDYLPGYDEKRPDPPRLWAARAYLRETGAKDFSALAATGFLKTIDRPTRGKKDPA